MSARYHLLNSVRACSNQTASPILTRKFWDDSDGSEKNEERACYLHVTEPFFDTNIASAQKNELEKHEAIA